MQCSLLTFTNLAVVFCLFSDGTCDFYNGLDGGLGSVLDAAADLAVQLVTYAEYDCLSTTALIDVEIESKERIVSIVLIE